MMLRKGGGRQKKERKLDKFCVPDVQVKYDYYYSWQCVCVCKRGLDSFTDQILDAKGHMILSTNPKAPSPKAYLLPYFLVFRGESLRGGTQC